MYRTKHQRVANRPGFACCSLSNILAPIGVLSKPPKLGDLRTAFVELLAKA
jgi:hypothetical protein